MQSIEKRKSRTGFTLIELLVVIAIIGLLAGIVLVSLGGARNAAKDARIMAAISQTRSLAELIGNSNNGSYVGAAPATTSLCLLASLNQNHTIYTTELTAIEAEVVAQKAGNVASCNNDATRFCVHAQLNATGQFYCIDSNGKAAQTGTNPGTPITGTCLGTSFVCPP